MRSACPDENEMSTWAAGHSSSTQAAVLSAHLDSCTACRGVFVLLTRPNTVNGRLRDELLAPVSPVAIGEVVDGKYEVVNFLGSGGMGVVVRARQLRLNSMVALKFVRPELAGDADVASRFLREARASSRLKSQHANRVLDFGQLAKGLPFMVMEYLEGETLETRVTRQGPLPETEVAKLMQQALDALGEAHALGIVHRDLKPGNLFAARKADGIETLVVLDFGVAKSINPDIEHGLHQTTLRGLVGSPAYMAPEQVTPGAAVDARTDIWALGCTMQTLLSGKPPFVGTDLVDLTWKIRNAEPAALPRFISAQMRACVSRCLQRVPADRFQSAKELANVLAHVESAPRTSRAPRKMALALAVVAIGVTLALNAPQPQIAVVSTERDVAPVLPVDVPRPIPTTAAHLEETPLTSPPKSMVRAPVRRLGATVQKVATPFDGGIDDVYGSRL